MRSVVIFTIVCDMLLLLAMNVSAGNTNHTKLNINAKKEDWNRIWISDPSKRSWAVEVLKSDEPFYPLSPQSQYYSSEQDRVFKTAEAFYKRYMPRLVPTNVPFAEIYTCPFRVPRGEINTKSGIYGNSFWIGGMDVSITIRQDGSTNCLDVFSNVALSYYIKTNEIQNLPSFPLEKAYSTALHYLELLDIKVNEHAELSELAWGNDGGRDEYGIPSVWRAVWRPSYGGFKYDDFLKDIYYPRIQVFFSEQYGFLSFSRTPFPPAPKTLEIRVSRKDAVFKAERAVPLVMMTPQYRQCRMPGFKPIRVKNMELRVAAPNWLLNPVRAVWLWEKPPEETRLCWIVRFATADTVDRGEMKLIPPDILIYIDAATGEIVGANFT